MAQHLRYAQLRLIRTLLTGEIALIRVVLQSVEATVAAAASVLACEVEIHAEPDADLLEIIDVVGAVVVRTAVEIDVAAREEAFGGVVAEARCDGRLAVRGLC